MATVIAPCSFAIWAVIGAAPPPVPPPIPPQMNTRCAPSSSLSMSGRSTSADFAPRSGYPPAPRPLVMLLPMSTLVAFSCTCFRCCLSVLIATSWLPFTPDLISLLMVLFPAPPTPTVTILIVSELSASSIPLDAGAFSPTTDFTRSSILSPL